MTMDNKKQRGGKRAGSGPKPKHGEKTRVLSIRVPVSIYEETKTMVENYITLKTIRK